MEFCLLGPLLVRRGGTVVPVPRGQQRVLLAALLLNANRVVSLDELTETLWGPDPPPTARVAIQNHVMRLRKALDGAGESRICTQPPGYVLHVEAAELDVTRFEGLLASARAAAGENAWDDAAARAREALTLWRDEPLADVDSERLALREVSRLAEMRLQALETRIDADLHLGHHAGAIPELRLLTGVHPLRERLHALLMLALYRDGRQAEALAAYQRARHGLVAELGSEPGTGLRELHRRMLTADTGLDLKPTRLAPAGPGPAGPRQLPAAAPHFVGRASELSALTGLLDRSGTRAPGAIVISAIGGTAGVGKTALAVHWAHQVADRFPDGQLYANLRGYDPAGVPARPADVARRFLNALGIPDRQIPSDPESCECLYRGELAGRRVLIVLDNARDAAQVRPLLPGGPGCFVLVTSRSQLTSLAVSDGASLLTVDLLDAADARELVARRLDPQRVSDEAEAVGELIELCARLPIAVSIAVARAAAYPAFALAGLVAELRDAGSRLDMLDAGDPNSSVRTVFSWSYEKLGAPAARMFRLLSVHAGPDISLPAAASLAGLARGQAQRAVSELAGSHLLAEHPRGRFTCHDLLRAYAADQTRGQDDDAERDAATHRLLDHYLHTGHVISRLLDPTLGELSLAPPQPGTLPEEPGDYGQAWAWAEAEHQVLLAVAIEAAMTRFASYAWQLLRTMESFFFRRGLWHQSVGAQQAALEAAVRVGDAAGQAHMHRGLGRVYALLGSFEDSQAHLSRAIAAFRASGNQPDEARAHINMGVALRIQGRPADALDQATQALRLYRAAGHLGGQAGALNNIGMYHIHLGDYEKAVAYGQQALAGFGELGNRHGVAHALDSIGYAYHFLGQSAQAITYYQQSLEAFREYGDRFSEADALIHLGDTHHGTGNQQAARRAWQSALDILDDIHHPEAGQVRDKLATLPG